jgi:hypothetical protein
MYDHMYLLHNVRRKKLLVRAVRRIQCKEYSRAWSAWRAHVTLQQVALTTTASAVAVTQAQAISDSQRTLALHCMAYWAKATQRRTLDRYWRRLSAQAQARRSAAAASALQQRTAALTIARLAHSTQQHSVRRCFAVWSSAVRAARTAEHTAAVLAATEKRVQQQLVRRTLQRVWHAWASAARTSRVRGRAVAVALTRVRSSTLRGLFAVWTAAVASAKQQQCGRAARKQQLLQRAVQQARSSSLVAQSQAWRTWRSAVYTLRCEAAESARVIRVRDSKLQHVVTHVVAVSKQRRLKAVWRQWRDCVSAAKDAAAAAKSAEQV